MIVISCNPEQERQVRFFLKTLESEGKVGDYFCTLIVQKGEKPTDKFLLSRCGIFEYVPGGEFFRPWTSSPRWRVEPKSEVVVCCDSDLLVLRDLNCMLRTSSEPGAINALVALSTPWEKSACNPRPCNEILMVRGEPADFYLNQWKRLFERLDVPFPGELYAHHVVNLPCSSVEQSGFTPFYPNHGFMVMDAGVFGAISREYYLILDRLNKLIHENYFMVQIAAALAIAKAGVKSRPLEMKYNYLNHPLMPEPSDIAVYHYAYSRESLGDLVKEKLMRNLLL